MCLLLITSLNLLSLCTAITLTTPGQSFPTSNWTVYNIPFSTSSGTPVTAVSNQQVDILDTTTNLMKMRYNYSTINTASSFPQGSVESVFSGTGFRADAYEDVKVELTVNLTLGALTKAYDSYVSVEYFTPSSPINLQVYYWKSSPTSCISTTVDLSGVQYGVRNTSAYVFLFERCNTSPEYLNTVIDLTQLNHFAIILGYPSLRPWYNRTSLKVITRVQGAGQLVLQHKTYLLERIQCVTSLQKGGTDFAIINQPIFLDRNRSDFVNVSLPINGSAQGIIFHMYLTQNPTAINGASWILLGTFYGRWKTPIHTLGLPVGVHDVTNMHMNFSFTISKSSIPTNQGACIIMNFRDDYNPVTQTFTNIDAGYISKKVTIIFWASQMFRAQFELNSPNYIRYFGTTWKILFQYGKEYNIWAQSSTDHLTNFNIFAFLVFLRDSMNAFTANEYLIGVQSGFRYITGQSRAIVNQFKVWQVNNNPINLSDEIVMLRTVECDMLTDDESVCQKTEAASVAITKFLSVPVIGVLMRFSPMISLVDEYAFYIYHRVKYDRGFRFIVKLCAEWTEMKWVPSFLEQASNWFNRISQLVADTNIDGQTIEQPSKFSDFGKKNNFYNNISNFFVISLPFNIITFILLAGLSWFARGFNNFRWMRKLLRPFQCFLNLWSSIVTDNMTYLSFHCFLQLYRIVPFSHGVSAYPSCIFCLLTLFAILMTCFLGVPIKLYAKKLFQIDYCKRQNYKSYLLFGTAAAGRFATGFFHAYIDDPYTRSLGLLMVNIYVVLVLIYCRKALHYKTYFWFYFGIYFSKVILNLQLFLEVWQMHMDAEWLTTENSILLVVLIFGLMLVLNLVSKIVTFYCQMKKLLVQDDPSRKQLGQKETVVQLKERNNDELTEDGPKKRRKVNLVKKKKKERLLQAKKISEEEIVTHHKTGRNWHHQNQESNQQIRTVYINRKKVPKGKTLKGALHLKLTAPKFQF